MKKYIFILFFGCSLLCGNTAKAQSVDELFQALGNMISSSDSDKKSEEPITHPDVYDLMGRWLYESLTLEYKGDNPMMGVVVSTLEGQLPTIASKFGLVAGRDYMDVADDGSLTFVQGEKRLSAYCSYYDDYTGVANLQLYIGSKSISIEATIVEQGGQTKVFFDAVKLMAILEKQYEKFSENTSLQMAKSLLDKTAGIDVGIVIKRQ